MAHINEVQMTYEEPCHTTDTLYLSAIFFTTLRNRNIW